LICVPPAIGIDFDHTIVDYDALLFRLARERGLVPPDRSLGKREVRDRIRSLHDGETSWQRLQAEIYGPRMAEADLRPGVVDFVRICRRRGVPAYIISHKTEVAAAGDPNVSLRAAAFAWMDRKGFFRPPIHQDGLGFRREEVFFESSRASKIARVRERGCTWFIDDLEEVFREPDFPRGVGRILLAHEGAAPPSEGVFVARSWRDIVRHVFPD
jgi:hypothetical protein